MDAPAANAKQPCCICDAPGGKHCTKCKSRHYCSKAYQLVDWSERGHKAQCKRLAAEFQDRLLDELMPAKLKIKEEPPLVEGVSLANGAKARLSAARAATKAEAVALSNGAPSWLDTCAICFDVLPVGLSATFYSCCCKEICTACFVKCRQHDERCPLCRAPSSKSADEWLRRLQKHVDKGNAAAQMTLGTTYFNGVTGLQQNFERAIQLFELAAAQGKAEAQNSLAMCYASGHGVEIDYETAVKWYRRAAEQGFPASQYNLGMMFANEKGVAQSYEEAVRWYRLAAAQGHAEALYNLGACHANSQGVPQDVDEALRLCKRAAAKGHAGAAAAVDQLSAALAAASAA